MNKTWTLALTIGLFAVGVTWAEEAAKSTETPAATATETQPAAEAKAAETNPEVDKIEAACVKAWGERKSMTAILEMSMSTSGPNFTISGEGSGKVMMLRKDGMVMSRITMNQKMTHKQGENERKMEQDIETVSDGKVAHTLTTMMGQKQCVKTDAESAMDFSPEQMFDSLEEQFTLSVKPEDKFNGDDVYVIEGEPKVAMPMNPMKKLRVMISKKYGVMLQQQFFGADDKPINTITFKDIKVDVPLEADTFEFKAPEGVQVIDRTGAS